MKKSILILGILVSACTAQAQDTLPTAPTRIVKVAILLQDPPIPSQGNQRIHEFMGWTDPLTYNQQLIDSLNAASHGAVKYEIERVIDDTMTFTRMKGNLLGRDTIGKLLTEPNWQTLKDNGTMIDYHYILDYYDFCEKSDSLIIDEVWIWAWPYGGGWESTLAGKNAFWCNSSPLTGTSCVDILPVMVFNYERTMDLALHSMGHRTEYTMKHAFGRWLTEPYSSSTVNVSTLNNWELFSACEKKAPGNSHVGAIHYPPNAKQDYDYANSTDQVTCFGVNNWETYPNIGNNSQMVTCSSWNCSQMGFMMWWFSRLPHFDCVDDEDGHLNNWWHYIADYEEALAWEDSLNQIECNTVNVREYIQQQGSSIFPNPAKEMIQIKSNENIEQVNVYDMNGKLVQQKKYSPSIPINTWSEGAYILELVSAEEKVILREKLFIQHD